MLCVFVLMLVLFSSMMMIMFCDLICFGGSGKELGSLLFFFGHVKLKPLLCLDLMFHPDMSIMNHYSNYSIAGTSQGCGGSFKK